MYVTLLVHSHPYIASACKQQLLQYTICMEMCVRVHSIVRDDAKDKKSIPFWFDCYVFPFAQNYLYSMLQLYQQSFYGCYVCTYHFWHYIRRMFFLQSNKQKATTTTKYFSGCNGNIHFAHFALHKSTHGITFSLISCYWSSASTRHSLNMLNSNMYFFCVVRCGYSTITRGDKANTHTHPHRK